MDVMLHKYPFPPSHKESRKLPFQKIILAGGILFIVALAFLWWTLRETPIMEREQAIQAIKRGDRILIGGVIREVNAATNEILVDIDPYGASKKYAVTVTPKTHIGVYNDPSPKIEPPAFIRTLIEEASSLDDVTINPNPTFMDLREGVWVEVHFEKHVDIDKVSPLAVTEILIILNKK